MLCAVRRMVDMPSRGTVMGSGYVRHGIQPAEQRLTLTLTSGHQRVIWYLAGKTLKLDFWCSLANTFNRTQEQN